MKAWQQWCRVWHRIEEGFIVLLMAAMVLVTFSQVIARYVFNAGWVAALELTQFLFAWLILFGCAYGIRMRSHLGVDALINALPPRPRRGLAIFGCLACILWGLTLLDSGWLSALLNQSDRGGALTYIQKMHAIDLSTEDLGWPRWLVYSVLPIGLLLFVWRCGVVLYEILTGKSNTLIASHELSEENMQSARDSEGWADSDAPPEQ